MLFTRACSFDNADAAERFLETACNLALDLAAFLEQRTHAIEAKEHRGSDGDDDNEGEHGEQSAGFEKNGEGEDGGKQTAAEIDKAGADEVAKTFDVVHDAVYEFAGLVSVEIGDGETADVDLNIVGTSSGRFVEIQGTAEREPFSEERLVEMLAAGRKGLKKLFAAQHEVLVDRLPKEWLP